MKVLKVDLSKCTGAQACVVACAQKLQKTSDPQFSAIQVARGPAAIDYRVCDQCGDCIPACPTQALTRAKVGAVLLKKDLCVGCFMCMGYCTKNAMMRPSHAIVPIKCISCGNCVDACKNGALSMVEMDHSQLPA